MVASNHFAYTGGNDFAATDKDPIHTLHVPAESIRTHRIGATIAGVAQTQGWGQEILSSNGSGRLGGRP